eukprot:jgi/Bigna1/68816/fgenesh1_pg.7_\
MEVNQSPGRKCKPHCVLHPLIQMMFAIFLCPHPPTKVGMGWQNNSLVRSVVDRVFGRQQQSDGNPQWSYRSNSGRQPSKLRIPLPSKDKWLKQLYPMLILCKTVQHSERLAGGRLWDRLPGVCFVSSMCIAPFLKPGGWRFSDVSFSPETVIHFRLSSLFTSNLMHVSLSHLIINLINLIQDGTILEAEIGSRLFVLDVTAISLLSRILHVVYGYLCARFLSWGEPYRSETVGMDPVCTGLRGRYEPLVQWTIDVARGFIFYPQYRPTADLTGIFGGLMLVYVGPWLYRKIVTVYRHSYSLQNGRLRVERPLIDRMLGLRQSRVHRRIHALGHDLHPLVIHAACAGLTLLIAYSRRHRGGY